MIPENTELEPNFICFPETKFRLRYFKEKLNFWNKEFGLTIFQCYLMFSVIREIFPTLIQNYFCN